MVKVTGREIFNQIDSNYYTLYVEWFNSHLKVMLLHSTKPPLSGKMGPEGVKYFCDELGKSCDEYLEETKKIFCGEDNDTEFFIQNMFLQWKRNIWTLGKIELDDILDIQIVCKSLQQLLKDYQNIQDEMRTLKESNTNLIDTNKELCSKMEKMTEMKGSMEQGLYKKFMLVLNSKKKRIKELEDIRKKKQNSSESVFNAATDESDGSDKEDETVNKIGDKRKLSNYNRPESLQKHRRIDNTSDEQTNLNASSSIDCTNDKVCNLRNCKSIEKKYTCGEQSCGVDNRNPRSSLNLLEEESEEELFSQ